MTTIVFPGQGTQYKGMGKQLFQEFPALVSQADQVLGYSVAHLCVSNPEKLLEQTRYAQPAIYVCNALSYLNYCRENPIQPETFFAGHSLGEISALFAAGCFDFMTGLRIVKKRAELMSGAKGGAMLAIVGVSQTRVESILATDPQNGIELANYNTPQQFVLSGKSQAIRKMAEQCNSMGIRAILLNTSGAFHSRQMSEFQLPFEQFLSQIPFSAPQHQVISNVTAQPYQLADIPALLSAQLASPVRWTESIQFLKTKGEADFVELGASSVLTKLIKDIPPVSIEIQTPAPAQTQVAGLTFRNLFGFKKVQFLKEQKGYFDLSGETKDGSFIVSKRCWQKNDIWWTECSFDISCYTDALYLDLNVASTVPQLSGAVPKRKAEFLAGRYAAATTLRAAGVAIPNPLLIPSDPNGCPVWPSGVAGSISHCRKLAVCALSDSPHIKYIGVDIEPIPSPESASQLASQVHTPAELAILTSVGMEPFCATGLLFSAKESIFKALYPLVQEYFGFESAVLKDVDVKKSVLEFFITSELKNKFGLADSYHCFFETTEDLILSWVVIPQDSQVKLFQPQATVG